MEGDRLSAVFITTLSVFQSTPSVWRETRQRNRIRRKTAHFNPLPPYGGRLEIWRYKVAVREISIHSLRMEGDSKKPVIPSSLRHFNPLPPYGGRQMQQMLQDVTDNFNPLPPYGGRLSCTSISSLSGSFQSTPSVWRETGNGARAIAAHLFQSTPSVWRETPSGITAPIVYHSFQSTPSVWRETGLPRR